MVKSRNVDVETDRNYTEDASVLRMVKGLDPVRFGELQRNGIRHYAEDYAGSIRAH